MVVFNSAVFSFVIPATPRTKKTSQRITAYGQACSCCHKKPYIKVMPSEAFEGFRKDCVSLAPFVRAGIAADLPITAPVAIEARIYRDANRGDWTGYMQALADVLQQSHGGMGIIADDRQIQHWDGSRLEVDRQNPRIEVRLEVFGGAK